MTRERRSYEWQSVEAGAVPLATRSGIEFFRGLADGSVPEQPITSTIGWRVDAVEKGMLRLRFEVQPWLLHGAGLLHGGVMATLLDSAMSGAIMSMLEKGQGCTTLQLSVTPVRAVCAADGPFLIEGRVTHVGSRVGTATGEMRDATGRLHAQGSTSALIF